MKRNITLAICGPLRFDGKSEVNIAHVKAAIKLIEKKDRERIRKVVTAHDVRAEAIILKWAKGKNIKRTVITPEHSKHGSLAYHYNIERLLADANLALVIDNGVCNYPHGFEQVCEKYGVELVKYNTRK